MENNLIIKQWFEEYIDTVIKVTPVFAYTDIAIKESKTEITLFLIDLLIPIITENNKVMNKHYHIFTKSIESFYNFSDKQNFFSYLSGLLNESEEYTQYLNRLNHEPLSTN